MNLSKKKQLVLALLILLISTSALVFALQNCNEYSGFHAASDFNPIETVYLIWSDEDSVVATDIASKVSSSESVTIFINNSETEEKIIKTQIATKGGDLANVTFIHMDAKPKNTWIRDFSPLFMKHFKNEKLKVVKLRYWDINTEITEFIANYEKLPFTSSEIYSLGGTREFNGVGTGIFVASHEKTANPEYNSDLKKFEKKLKKQFQLKKIIWLNQGIPQDELQTFGMIDKNVYPLGSNNHVDEFCRFIAPGKIMISYISDSEIKNNRILAEAKKRLDENYWILKNTKDQDGNYFEIIPMPFAPVVIRPLYDSPNNTEFRTDVTSYMNFLITNNTVILPSYRFIDQSIETHEKEEFISKTFKKYFPEKHIIFINPGRLNSRGGGIHCLTASKPALKPINSKKNRFMFRKKRKA